MLKLTVYKYLSDKQATVVSDQRRALLDHLEASAARNGFEITWIEPGEFGELHRDGREVGGWYIEEIEEGK